MNNFYELFQVYAAKCWELLSYGLLRSEKW